MYSHSGDKSDYSMSNYHGTKKHVNNKETCASVEVVSMRRARQQRNIFGSSSMEFLNKFFFLIEFNRVLHKFFSMDITDLDEVAHTCESFFNS